MHWLYHEAGRFFPEQWRRYADGDGNADDLVVAYDRLLNAGPDPDVRARAGHQGGEEMTEHMMTALNRFARP